MGLLLQITQTYLQDLLKHNRAQSKTTKIYHKKIIIVRCNIFLHTSNEVKDYIAKTEVIIYTINSYFLCLNPT